MIFNNNNDNNNNNNNNRPENDSNVLYTLVSLIESQSTDVMQTFRTGSATYS